MTIHSVTIIPISSLPIMEKIIVHYHRHWLPGKTVECILEPQVLLLCLLRRLYSLKIILKPSIYDDFMHSKLPAALVSTSKLPLSQEKLMTHLQQSVDCHNREGVELTEYDHYEENTGDINVYIGRIHTDTFEHILNTYISTHLRHAILYLLWIHPSISHFTLAVTLASVPLPYGYYEFYKKKRRVKEKCREYGYYCLEHTLRELVIILCAIKRFLNVGATHVGIEEGYVFSNLATLFSIPCRDVKEVLDLHVEFADLKRYCIKLNQEHNIVSLKPPFLSGDTISVKDFERTFLSKLVDLF